MSAICEDLRAAIFRAAMQGKLTERRPEDGSADGIIEQLGLSSVNNALMDESEAPFDIPESWRWIKLEGVADLLGGNAFKSSDFSKERKEKFVRVIRISDFNSAGIIEKSPVYIADNPRYNNYEVSDNDILMCMTGGTVGKCCIIKKRDEKLLLNQRVANIRTLVPVLPEFIYLCLSGPDIQAVINASKNSTNDNISAALIRGFAIPLPPLAEQKRIVEKVDELMARVAEGSFS